MYTLYYIPKRKEWGCTNDLNRRVKELGYKITDVERIILVGEINKATNMERELNIEYGFEWNESKNYKRVLEIGHKGGLTQGEKNKKSGFINKIQKISRTGTKHSQESKEKMKLARTGTKHSEETRKIMSERIKESWKLRKLNKLII